jgi:signal transduction histidine kinase
MMRHARRRHGPPWWPDSKPWPPRGGARGDPHGRVRFFRRMAVAAFVLLLLGMGGTFALTWIVTSWFGVAGWVAALLAALVLFAAVLVVKRTLGAMGRFTSPLGAVMDAADRVAAGDYTVRVPEHGPPPMRALTHSFNAMTERLQHADRQRRDLMADLAHELRTPLTVLRGRLEGLADGVYPRDDSQLAQLLDETRVLSRLIEDLRTLAISDAGVLALQRESTDLLKLVRDVVHGFDTEAAGRSIELNVREPVAPVWVDIDEVRMREVLANLVSNALRHTPSGRSVDVSVNSAHDSVTIAVQDTGEGLAPEVVARIFDRFYKGPDSRGSGLGLAIARSLVNAHGGEITAASEPGKGTTVTVTLPRRDE